MLEGPPAPARGHPSVAGDGTGDGASASRIALAAAAAVFVAALALYVATAAPSIVELFDDSLEFQLVGPTLGIPHPTGYPLYVLGGWIWSRLLFPFGNWAWRMNLFSALFGALTVAVLFHLTARLVTRAGGQPNWWAAAAAAALFGLSPTWWSQTTVAEVYALHNFLVVAVISAAIGVNQRANYGASRTAPHGRAFNRRMTLLALLLGLSFTHHRTSVLLVPPITLYLLWTVPGIWRPQRAWLLWLAALLAPLGLYGLLPLRASMGIVDLNASYVNTWTGFWDHVLARRYAAFFSANPLAVDRTLREWLTLFRLQLGVPGLLLAALGVPWLLDRHARLAPAWVFVLFVGLTNLLFAVNYRVGDVEVFLLPVLLCVALFAGAGLGTLERWLEPSSPRLSTIVQASAIALIIASVGIRDAIVDRHQEWAVHDYAVAMAKVPFAPGSRVIGLEGEMTALKYMQQAEGLAPNALPKVADDPTARAALLADISAQGLPVYLTRELAGIEQAYSFTGDGPLVRVWPRGQASSGLPTHELDIVMANGALRLVGYDAVVLEQAGGPALALSLYWHPVAELAGNYKLSLRVTDEAGEPLRDAAGEELVADRFPLRQVAPTWSWLPGETVRDVQIIALPRTWHTQATTLQLILYDAESVEELGRWQLDLGPLATDS